MEWFENKRVIAKDFKVILVKEKQQIDSIKKSSHIKDIDSYLLLDKKSYQIDKNTFMFRDQVKIRLVDTIFDIKAFASSDGTLESLNSPPKTLFITITS